jgi:hypothetical protein
MKIIKCIKNDHTCFILFYFMQYVHLKIYGILKMFKMQNIPNAFLFILQRSLNDLFWHVFTM